MFKLSFFKKNNNDRWLIVGLGNPGANYKQTRHNAGFLLVDFIHDNYGNFSDWKINSRQKAFLSKAIHKEKEILLAKPQSFMNLSGSVVGKIINCFKVPKEHLIVCHDDVDLPLGRFRISKNSGSAGHKGVQSIIDSLSSKNFTRIRLGIETRQNKKNPPTENYVLKKFTRREIVILKKVFAKIILKTDELLK